MPCGRTVYQAKAMRWTYGWGFLRIVMPRVALRAPCSEVPAVNTKRNDTSSRAGGNALPYLQDLEPEYSREAITQAD